MFFGSEIEIQLIVISPGSVKAGRYALLPQIIIISGTNGGKLVGGFTRARHGRIVQYFGCPRLPLLIVLHLFFDDVFQLEFETFTSQRFNVR
jgi:hypothetical protein